MEDEYLIWRIWGEKGVSLNELRYRWTYEDLLHANAYLDMSADINTAIDGLAKLESQHEPGGNDQQ